MFDLQLQVLWCAYLLTASNSAVMLWQYQTLTKLHYSLAVTTSSQPHVICFFASGPGMDGRVIARNNTPSIILAGQANSTKGMGQLDAADGPYYVLLNSTEGLY